LGIFPKLKNYQKIGANSENLKYFGKVSNVLVTFSKYSKNFGYISNFFAKFVHIFLYFGKFSIILEIFSKFLGPFLHIFKIFLHIYKIGKLKIFLKLSNFWANFYNLKII
jgi:hypothetical protein